MNLSITKQNIGDWTVLSVSGEVDIVTAPQLREELHAVIADGGTQVAVETSDVGFMDSTGLGVLVGGLKRLRQADGDLVVVCSTPPVRKILEITGLMDVFKVSESLDDLRSST